MKMLKLIKNKSDHKKSISEIEKLIELQPDRGTSERDKLDVLVLIVEEYEKRKYPFNIPDPISALKFRMEQKSLTQRDLIPFLGSRSKASEILSGKRSLTISMMRALHNGLGIPAKVLLGEYDRDILKESNIDWTKFPINEMVKRHWIKETINEANLDKEKTIRKFISPIIDSKRFEALYRRTNSYRSSRTANRYALAIWTVRILTQAMVNPPASNYNNGTITLDTMRQIAQLSSFKQGPRLAIEFLSKQGISVIIEPHHLRTYLDGSAIMVEDDKPIIGLTIRYDRLDNFWFTLMHELAHISMHFGDKAIQFYDDLEIENRESIKEQSANELASHALIPKRQWTQNTISNLKSIRDIINFAGKLKIHPAIIAGRIQHETKNYRKFSRLIGKGQVRQLFPEINWTS